MSSPSQAIELHDPGREVTELRARIQKLEFELGTLRGMIEQHGNAVRLSLSAVFRHMAEELADAPGTVAATPASNTKWDSWKQRLSRRAAEFIDLLLVHKELSAAQLMGLAKCAKRTVYDVTSEMGKVGILEKHGSKYSLKEL